MDISVVIVTCLKLSNKPLQIFSNLCVSESFTSVRNLVYCSTLTILESLLCVYIRTFMDDKCLIRWRILYNALAKISCHELLIHEEWSGQQNIQIQLGISERF